MKAYIILSLVMVSLLVGCSSQVPASLPPEDIEEIVVIEDATHEEVDDNIEYVREEIKEENITTIEENLTWINISETTGNDYINEEQ